jgi:hypothetical protein
MKFWMLVVLASLLTLSGCDKNSTEPEDTSNKLTEEEQMEIIATEIAANEGGLMADIQVAAATADDSETLLAKPTGVDTTFTYNWITYKLSLKFYTKEGREQLLYVTDVTDKINYQSTLSGKFSELNGRTEIDLDRGSSLEVKNILSDTVTYNGSAFNKSEYKLTVNRASLLSEANSTYTLKNLVVDLNSTNYIPLAGKLEAVVKGVYAKDGLITDNSFEYSISFSIEFKGSNEVKITLPSGTQFTLNLITGEVTE